MLSKPPDVFERTTEWRALASFATRESSHALLAVVSGRWRVGKSYLLRALTEQCGGFHFAATAATAGESLRWFGAALAEYTGAPAPFSFATWDHAVTFLFGLADPARGDRPQVIVLDEFPYLAKVVPELPSLLQREIDRYQSRPSRMRLLLCGSAMSVMGGLLAGSAPLRGRAQLELGMRPFDYRAAARFWDVAGQPELAVRLGAVVGGTPAYRRQFLDGDVPDGLTDFDDWVCRAVMSPLSPLFREARYLLAEEADIRDTSLYHSVLAAVAAGNNTRGGIAGFIGRKAVDISHPLNVLEDSHLLTREVDVFRQGKSRYRIAEPLITFYEAIMRPAWGRLELGSAREVWATSSERFAAQVVGPHFETLCRDHLLGPGADLGNAPLGRVGAGVVTDPSTRTSIEIDAAIVEGGDGGHRPRAALLGETKWGTVMGLPHLERLTRARDVLTARGMDTEGCLLVCFGAAGFTDHLRRQADARDDVRLIGLPELYA